MPKSLALLLEVMRPAREVMTFEVLKLMFAIVYQLWCILCLIWNLYWKLIRKYNSNPEFQGVYICRISILMLYNLRSLRIPFFSVWVWNVLLTCKLSVIISITCCISVVLHSTEKRYIGLTSWSIILWMTVLIAFEEAPIVNANLAFHYNLLCCG